MKAFNSLFGIAAIGMGLVGSPELVQARTFPARGGSSGWHSDASCWSPWGPAMTNTCSTNRDWYMPMVVDGSWFDGTFNGTVTVTAQGASNSSNVICFGQGWDKWGNWLWSSGQHNLSTFGSPSDIPLSVWIPAGGTGMVDCDVYPGGKVITISW